MALSQTRFLLDENIPSGLLRVFHQRDLNIDTVQSMGWSGIKNGDLAEKLDVIYMNQEINCVLVAFYKL